jgi:hypothetical protein
MKKDTIRSLIFATCDLYWIPYLQDACVINGDIHPPLFGMKELWVLKYPN